MSGGSADAGGAALAASTLTLGRAAPAEYEPARHAAPPASLERRHYVPTYVGTCTSFTAPFCVHGCSNIIYINTLTPLTHDTV